ncbi:hypothetical protein HCN44_010384 [Aphidius gifuensis]|uniref:EGF-like domain-containing protein n=1 Tax=Aphidius gifuensis TaxID=684658 RepID=A0A834XWA2_APHGI|nr:hypothetical protein HCN44_010384 [Aphidius gifuensis]
MKIDSRKFEPVEIIKLPNTSLRGLAIDTCSRKFYWSSSDKLNPSTSSCNYDEEILYYSGYERIRFIGDHCEISVCWNYCFQGKFIVTEKNKPQCNCSSLLTGPRCLQNIRTGYCLNDVKCSVKNGEPFCNRTDSSGTRCEIKIHDNCQNNCTKITNNINNTSDAINTSCRCPKIKKFYIVLMNFETII